MGQVLTKNSGTNYDAGWANVGSAARPLLTGGAYLSGSGLVLAALGNNNATTPSAAALNITGDIDIIARVAANDWTPTANRAFVCKFDAGQKTYAFELLTSGKFRLVWSTDGSTNIVADSTVAPTVSDGSTLWIRVTHDVDNGATGNDVAFYTAADSASVPTSWTQLGTTVTGAGTTSHYSGTARLAVGAEDNNGYTFDGTIYRAIVKNGIGGTTVFDADFSTQTADALAFTESSSNAATVTINTTRYSYGVPTFAITSATTAANAANTDYYTPFIVSSPTVVDMSSFEVTTGPASTATVYVALYAADNNFQPTGSPLVNYSQSVASGASGVAVYRQSLTPVTLQPGAYVTAYNTTVSFTQRLLRMAMPASYKSGANTTTTFEATRTAASFTSSPTAWSSNGQAAAQPACWIFLRYKAA